MKTKMALSLIAAANLILSGAAFAAGAKTYQVTGTVVAATGSMVTVQQGGEKFHHKRFGRSQSWLESHYYLRDERDESGGELYCGGTKFA